MWQEKNLSYPVEIDSFLSYDVLIIGHQHNSVLGAATLHTNNKITIIIYSLTGNFGTNGFDNETLLLRITATMA